MLDFCWEFRGRRGSALLSAGAPARAGWRLAAVERRCRPKGACAVVQWATPLQYPDSRATISVGSRGAVGLRPKKFDRIKGPPTSLVVHRQCRGSPARSSGIFMPFLLLHVVSSRHSIPPMNVCIPAVSQCSVVESHSFTRIPPHVYSSLKPINLIHLFLKTAFVLGSLNNLHSILSFCSFIQKNPQAKLSLIFIHWQLRDFSI